MSITDTFTFNPDTTEYDPANAYWLGKAARLAYRDGAQAQSTAASWGFDRFRSFDHGDTQCYVAGNAKMVMVAFRGTQPLRSQGRAARRPGLLVPLRRQRRRQHRQSRPFGAGSDSRSRHGRGLPAQSRAQRRGQSVRSMINAHG